MKKILGLDLGTNSIGWALIEKDEINKNISNEGRIIDSGSRIIPMPLNILSDFDRGISISQTAERTAFRGIRRLRERHLLRRERLHRVLKILDFLPLHYSKEIDFEKRFGQFIVESEPKICYNFNPETQKSEFLFKKSFSEMLDDFKKGQPQLLINKNGKEALIPYDWTLYYLRKKALTQKIEKEELSWILLNFNQKRGYYQLRGEDEETENQNKLSEFYSLRVVNVLADDTVKGKSDLWYSVHLENGFIYRRSSKEPLFNWVGKTKEFIVTTELNEDKSIKKDKEGNEKRSFKSVDSEKDWIAIKKSTEEKIEKSKKTVGEYIYETLLKYPDQKIRGKLVRVIERKYYKSELESILRKQKEFHQELGDKKLYSECLEELYENNDSHRNSIIQKDFTHLFLNDIIFYQRPLKSKKHLISNCKFENRVFVKDGIKEVQALKCIAKSHPLFQEFRLWQFIQNLKIYQKEKTVDGKLQIDANVTNEFLKSDEDYVKLFDWLNNRKEVDQKSFLKYPGFNLKKNIPSYRWNYVEDKYYPCNETRALIISRLAKIENLPIDFLESKQKEEAIWHILYSIEDKAELLKALKTFAVKNDLGMDFVELFSKVPPFKKDYGSYSAKAIKKFLPLMRMGVYWIKKNIHPQTLDRIQKILTGEYDENIRERVRDKSIDLNNIEDFKGLPTWLVSYIVYDRHSEGGETKKWKKADDIKLLEQHSLRNPIVERIINETLQVVREIWNKYGNGVENYFDEIHIELGREMKNPSDKRKSMSEKINENENTNLRIKSLLMELLNDSKIENVRPYSPMQQEILKIYEEGVLSAVNGNIPDDIAKISKLAQPSNSELAKYKLWLEQKYCSPYTGNVISLSKLFTSAYEIEHVIPQSRFFDDSFSNKVICEEEINKDKGNCTAYEYIKNNRGKKIELSNGNEATLFNVEQYEDFVNKTYGNARGKKKKLLMEDVPETFIQRQLNDTRYISKVVTQLMSNIVRDKEEQESVSKNVLSSNGTITSVLKQDWGLNDVWNELITPRFERLNEITNSNKFGEWTNKDGNKVFQIQIPFELQKGFSKKRIDHRHHALDAIVVACTTRSHINYLNNESSLGKDKKEIKEKRRYDLKQILCNKKYIDQKKQNYKWVFKEPWKEFKQNTKDSLSNIIVSFKQNLRIINKTINKYQVIKKNQDGKLIKKIIKQTKGENWAIRKPMHKDTVSGLIKLKFIKKVTLYSAIQKWETINDLSLRNKIKELLENKMDNKKIIKYFKDLDNKWEDKDISRTEIYYYDNENVASRVKIDESFNTSKIESISDRGIQKIMNNHLLKFNTIEGNKTVEHPELAFSIDGVDEMNKNIKNLNDGVPHKPIYKVRTYEPKGNKYAVGQTGNKKDKFVEAAKGTNLFFAIYQDEKGKRCFETIPLNIVIERQKQGLSSVPEKDKDGNQLLFHLSPNDLVYVPVDEESLNLSLKQNKNLNNFQSMRIYKFVDSSDTTANFIPFYVANLIYNLSKIDAEKLKNKYDLKYEGSIIQNEYGLGSPQSKNQNSIDGKQIKSVCWKLKVDRLGNIKNFIK